MSKLGLCLFLLGVFFFTTALRADDTAAANGPCKDKREAKHAARTALHTCLEGWAKSGAPNAPEPSDDCTAKTSAFVQAAKDIRACHAEHMKKKAG